MGFFHKKPNKHSVAGSEDDVALAEKKSPSDKASSAFKMMDRQEIYAPDLTSPVISALIAENVEAGQRREPGYSITDVMKLVNALPNVSNPELAMVIRTISSFGVDVKAMIKEAIEKERMAGHRIERLKKDIESQKARIRKSQDEIGLLQMGLVELEKSKDYLIKGMRLISDASLADLESADATPAEINKPADTDVVTPSASTDNKRKTKAKTKSKSKAKSKRKSTAKTASKTKTTAKTAKSSVAVVNNSETVELTSINLDVQPIKQGKKSR